METISLAFDEALCDKGDAKAYVELLNGISWTCQNGGYRQGSRNTIAVDLTVAAYELGLDPFDMLEWFGNHGLILDDMDDEYPKARVNNVMRYAADFSWSWMIDPGQFVVDGVLHVSELEELKFEIA